MLTGDYASTAKNIASQIGLANFAEVITGPELREMSSWELTQKIKTVNVFARILPEQKLRIVNALKENGEIVAMTGDGVNDAPALKAAEIGIAMGERGNDVAREAASLVLLDDDFASIVAAIRMGRRIFDNIKKAVVYTIGVHIPIIGITLMTVLGKLPLMLFPVHIVFLELIIDPACSVVFEGEDEEENIMTRPPRSSQERLFKKEIIFNGLMQGVGVFIMIALTFVCLEFEGMKTERIRALLFFILVVSNLGLIFANRTWKTSFISWFRGRNKALWWLVAMSLFFLGIILYLPFSQKAFHFASLTFADILLGFIISAGSFVWFYFVKLLRMRLI